MQARELIETLGLAPHPEGGWYREVYRSASSVAPADGRPARDALTTIYFLLESHQHSRWHRVLSDEVWVYLGGVPLALYCCDAQLRTGGTAGAARGQGGGHTHLRAWGRTRGGRHLESRRVRTPSLQRGH